MLSKLKVGLVACAIAATPIVTAVPADAATTFSNCDALHRVYKHGVAKSDRAARKQVRDGYGRPASGTKAQKVYWANYGSLDRDKDGTACEA